MSFQPQSNERPSRHRSSEPNYGYGLEKNQPAPSNPEGGLSKFLMIGLVALALIASVVTVMTDSDGWMKIAILAALWAAFIGVFLVVRYSSALKNEREQHSLREGEHRAELEREKSRAREELARAESDFAQRAKATRDEQIEMLRAEVENLRSQLEGMGAGDLSDYGPRAVRARAERIVELENRGQRSTTSRDTRSNVTGGWPQAAAGTEAQERQRVQPQQQRSGQPQKNEPRSAQPSGNTSKREATRRNSGGFSTGSFAAVRWTGQDTEATTQIPLVVDTSTMNGNAESERAQTQTSETNGSTGRVGAAGAARDAHGAHGSNASRAAHASGHTGTHDPNHRAAHAGSEHAGTFTTGAASSDAATPGTGRQDQPAEPIAPEGTQYRGGRRRADEGGLTVAELLQRSKNKKR